MTSGRKRPSYLIAILITAAVAAIAAQLVGPAEPAAAQARNLRVVSQGCTSQGAVQVTFAWTPSGRGSQWLDFSRLANFTAWGNEGPFSSQVNSTVVTLSSNVTYFARVSTFEPQGLTRSNTLQFRSITCPGAFTPAHNLDADVFDDFVRVSWQRGTGNSFFCVDTARTQSDLVNQRNTWRNWGSCGTQVTHFDLTQLGCGRTYFYRVFAAGSGGSGHSVIDSFVTEDCNFTPPSNPSATVRSDGSVRIRWDRGTDNRFFCIDFAFSEDDLVDLEGSWFNSGCGQTATSVTVTGLDCGRVYFYRIWAAGTQESGYTEIDSFATPPCDFEPPDDLDVEVVDDGHVVFSWDEQDPAFWFCVDVAGSQSDLLGFSGSWRNFDCGGTDEMADITDDYFECGETYFWRVYAFAGSASGYSEVDSFEMTC
jgi:hypothetical protein